MRRWHRGRSRRFELLLVRGGRTPFGRACQRSATRSRARGSKRVSRTRRRRSALPETGHWAARHSRALVVGVSAVSSPAELPCGPASEAKAVTANRGPALAGASSRTERSPRIPASTISSFCWTVNFRYLPCSPNLLPSGRAADPGLGLRRLRRPRLLSRPSGYLPRWVSTRESGAGQHRLVRDDRGRVAGNPARHEAWLASENFDAADRQKRSLGQLIRDARR